MGDQRNPKAPSSGKLTRIPPDEARLERPVPPTVSSDSGAGSDLPTFIGDATSAGEARSDATATVIEPVRPTTNSSEDPMNLASTGRRPPPSEAPTLVEVSPSSSRRSDPSELPTLVDAGRVTGAGAPPTTSSPWQVPTLLPGTVLAGRYEIRKTVGEGGMGSVYQAEDRELGRIVALKVIRPELASNPEILQRFKQEILLASKVTDRNIIRIYDLGDAHGVKFITMEYLEGEDLRAILRRRGKVSPAEAVEIMEQVVSGLEAAHRLGIVHRDLKPGNIMLGDDGRVHVMDFGLARSLAGDGMTRTGTMLGTMEYMSPEQAQAREVDARSDIFTVGLILYELITGSMPFQADSAIASLLKRTQQRAVPISEIDRNVPGVLSNIVSKCLERDPALRYQSAGELVADLRAWQGKSGSSKVSVSSAGLLLNRARELPRLKIAAAVVLIVILSAIGSYFGRKPTTTSVTHAPISVLVADFQNNTSDPLFDNTLEPMINVALEGAGFINAYNRSNARQLAGKLSNPSSKLDPNSARLVAVNEGIAAIVTGALGNQGNGYTVSAKAIDAVTGRELAAAHVTAENKDELLLDIPKLAAPIRKALGDTTPESVQVKNTAGAFTTSSLAAVHQYGVGMEQLWAGNSEQALQSFSNAIALDPNFARVYGGMASAYGNLGKTQDQEKYVKLAMEHVDRMTERERYRVRGLYYYATSNYPKCIEEYGELVKRFPADNVAWINIAACYSALRRMPEAVGAAQRAVQISPKGAVQRMVLSFYSSYGGDFVIGEREASTALELNPFPQAYLALAEAQLGLGQMSQATETYHKMEKTDALGASLATSGLADIASYEGQYADAVRILDQGVTTDLASKNPDNAAEKLAGISYLQLLRGQKGASVAATTKALALSQSVPVRVLAARTLLEAGELGKAQKLADGLVSEAQPETQAYGKIIRGDLALQRGQKEEAIKLFTDANQLLDTWIGRFELGRAYLEAGLFVEADSEFDRCMKRRGEALEIFQDSVPTFAYFPPLYYYEGRVREGLKSPGFAEAYHTYLDIRGKATDDPLVVDIRHRLRQ